MNVKGKYEIKLIDINTNEILYEHTQHNLITDYGYIQIAKGNAPNYLTLGHTDSELDPNVDYRKYKTFTSMGFTTISTSPSMVPSYSNSYDTMSHEYNFPTPESDRLINILAISDHSNYIYSFIKLTNPIQQLSTTILYIKYSITVAYIGDPDTNNATANPWVNEKIRRIASLAQGNLYDESNVVYYVTPFQIDDITECTLINNDDMRYQYIYTTPTIITWVNSEHTFSQTYNASLSLNESYGQYQSVIGVYQQYNSSYSMNDIVILSGYELPKVPYKGNIIQHGATDTYTQTNTSIVPQGYGSLSIDGDHNCSTITKAVEVKITHSGDASNIYQDRITFNSSDNTFTPTDTSITEWDNDICKSIVRVSFSGDSLPPEITEDAIYYLIYNDTSLKVALTESDALNNIEINLSDNGSGDITITRESTALMNVTTFQAYYPDNFHYNMQPNYDTNGNPIFTLIDTNRYYIPWSVKINNHLYYACIQDDTHTPSYSTTNIALCKWKHGSLNRGIAIEYIPSPKSNAYQLDNKLLISTENGVVIFDTDTDTILNTIPILDNTASVYQMKLDEANGNLVIFHSLGFSVCNPSEFINDGSLLDTVLLSETSLTGWRIGSSFDVYDNIIGNMDGAKTVSVFHWDGIDTITGQYFSYYIHNASYIYSHIYIHRDGSKNFTAIVGQYSIDNIHSYTWNNDSYDTPSMYNMDIINTSANCKPTSDSNGNIYISNTSDNYTSTLSIFNVYSQTLIKQDVSVDYAYGGNSNTYGGNTDLPTSIVTSIDDTPCLLCGARVIPLYNTSIHNGKLELSNDSISESSPVPLSTISSLVNNLDLTFANVSDIASESQFIKDERYTQIIAATTFKGNMDEASLKLRHYVTDTRKYEGVDIVVDGNTLTIPESTEMDFRAVQYVVVIINDVTITDLTISETTGVITLPDDSYDTQTATMDYIVVYRR